MADVEKAVERAVAEPIGWLAKAFEQARAADPQAKDNRIAELEAESAALLEQVRLDREALRSIADAHIPSSSTLHLHTPWRVMPGIPYLACGDVGPTFGPITLSAHCSADEMQAMAVCMAAAPEMLLALKTARNQCVAFLLDVMPADQAVANVAYIDAVLAKAECT